MFYYIYEIEWSISDKDIAIIRADPNTIANKLKSEFPGAKYYQLIGKTSIIIT